MEKYKPKKLLTKAVSILLTVTMLGNTPIEVMAANREVQKLSTADSVTGPAVDVDVPEEEAPVENTEEEPVAEEPEEEPVTEEPEEEPAAGLPAEEEAAGEQEQTAEDFRESELYYPNIAEVEAEKRVLPFIGGSSKITVKGEHLKDNIQVEVFEGGKAAPVSGSAVGDDSEQTVTLSFPENNTENPVTYTVKVSGENVEEEKELAIVVEAMEDSDIAPMLEDNLITVNKLYVANTVFMMYPQEGAPFTADGKFYTLSKGNYKEMQGITYESIGADAYAVTAESKVKNKTYTLYVKTETAGREYYSKLKVKVISDKPKFTVKSSKINAFYTDKDNRTSTLTFTNPTDLTIEKLELDEALAAWFELEYDTAKQEYQIVLKEIAPDTLLKQIKKSGKLIVTTEEYRDPIKLSLSVPMVMKAPSLTYSATSSKLNINLDKELRDVSFEVYAKNGKLAEEVDLDSVEFVLPETGMLYSDKTGSGNTVTLTVGSTSDFVKKVKTQLLVKSKEWLKPVKITHTVQVVDELPTVKFKGTVTIDRKVKGSGGRTKLVLSAAPANGVDYLGIEEGELACTSKNKNTAPKVTLTKVDETTYDVEVASVSGVKKENYYYSIYPKLSNGTSLKKATLTVSVKESDDKVGVEVEWVKDTEIDLVDRENTYAEFTLDPTNSTTYVSDVVAWGGKYDVEKVMSGKNIKSAKLRAKPNAGITPKSHTVTLYITLSNKYSDVVVKKKSVSVEIISKEKAVSFKMSKTGANVYKDIPDSQTSFVISVDKPITAKLGKIKQTDTAKTKKAFDVAIDQETGKIVITLKDPNKVKTKKKYTFTFKVKAAGANKEVTKKFYVTVR